ncbi:MAG: serine/threonine-protein kinase [Zavarzinella sp.]
MTTATHSIDRHQLSNLKKIIVQSELIPQAKFDQFLSGLHARNVGYNEPIDLLQLLVYEGLLTKFQARLLLQGKWKNFLIDNKYVILDQLGKGGMGTVFLCEHRHMKRRVAIKVLPPETTSSPTMVHRFQREAEAVARVNHPNIVRAHDIGSHKNMHYLVMEYIDGVNLHELVTVNGRLAIDRAVDYIIQSARGLACAHAAGVVHRDVKPGNILVDRSGTIKVLDLGLARMVNDDRGSVTMAGGNGTLLGTADYVAPEQALDARNVGHLADIYSLGATFYFLLTGRAMYPEGNMAQKLISHQIRHVQSPRQIRPEVPDMVNYLVMSMIAKKPHERPEDMVEVIETLQEFHVPVLPPDPDEMPVTAFAGRTDMSQSMRGPASQTTRVFHQAMMNTRHS